MLWVLIRIAVIYLKFKQNSTNLRVFCQNHVNGIANSEDIDQTAQSDLGLHCLPRPFCPKTKKKFLHNIILNIFVIQFIAAPH